MCEKKINTKNKGLFIKDVFGGILTSSPLIYEQPLRWKKIDLKSTYSMPTIHAY